MPELEGNYLETSGSAMIAYAILKGCRLERLSGPAALSDRRTEMFDIQEELKKLPAKPGVYLMHNSKDEIIYVGKAIKLCNRVRQYFQDSRNLSVKIQHMVKNVAYFEYIITDSELEALVLENNLIKEHHPKYNTKLKDDKGYPYIKVTVNEEFPRIMLARKMKADGESIRTLYECRSSK